MEVKNNVLLKEYTTLKIGGIAKNFYLIETIKDLENIINSIYNNFYIIANGSNLLINDKKMFENVIYMNKFNKFINEENGIFEVSASVKIQELTNFINEKGYGGIEYLYSVPSTIGGAIYMNAGRGKLYNKSLSDYILDVTIYDGEALKVLSKTECNFNYRSSIFKTKKWIIISARFKFESISIEESTKLKKERIAFSKKYLDSNNKTAGSVFKLCNVRIMNIIRKLNLGWKNGISYSSKTNNWINNNGQGTYKQAKILINIVKIIHRIFFKKIELEYIEWK